MSEPRNAQPSSALRRVMGLGLVSYVLAGLRRLQTTPGCAGRKVAYNTGMRPSARLAGSPPGPRLASTRHMKQALVRALRTDRTAGIVAVAVLVPGGGALAWREGAGAVVPHLSDVGAWLSSTKQGSVVHANRLVRQTESPGE